LDLHRKDSRKRLAVLMVNLFEKWRVSTKNQAKLLGIDHFDGFCLPNNEETIERASLILFAHKALRKLYPLSTNEEDCYAWVNQQNADFGNKPPLEFMTSSKAALAKTARYLDHLCGV